MITLNEANIPSKYPKQNKSDLRFDLIWTMCGADQEYTGIEVEYFSLSLVMQKCVKIKVIKNIV